MALRHHEMDLPRKVIVGRGILHEVGDVCRQLGRFRSALLLTGPNTLHVAGEDVESSLRNAGLEVRTQVVDGFTTQAVKRSRKAITNRGHTIVVGVGGGKVIDVAKLGSAAESVPFVSVPTAASHDGVASTHASIRGASGSASVKAQAPLAIIGDVGVIANSPRRLTASGCGDIVAKLTAVRDWRLAHKMKGEYYGDYAASLALMSARLVMRNANAIKSATEEGVRVLLEALISCGVAMSIAGSSRPCSGSEHLFSHALDAIAPKVALHGEQCGVGTIMMAYLHGTGWEQVRKFLSTVGAPTTSEELGVEADLVVRALTTAHKVRPDRYTILGDRGLTEAEARELAEATGVV